jgi:hypothetical protein
LNGLEKVVAKKGAFSLTFCQIVSKRYQIPAARRRIKDENFAALLLCGPTTAIAFRMPLAG